MRQRIQGSNTETCFITWKTYANERIVTRLSATKIQALWRGQLAREYTENLYYMRIWACLFIQTAWRGRAARAIAWQLQRRIFLREFNRAEAERCLMEENEQQSRAYFKELDYIVLIQRSWRGIRARDFVTEVKRSLYLHRKKLQLEKQEQIRLEAEEKQAAREAAERCRSVAAIHIQRIGRGYIARIWFATQQDKILMRRSALKLQSTYRGRIGRRLAWAARRNRITRLDLLARRSREASVLRKFNATTRETQKALRGFLRMFGLEPETFMMTVKSLAKDVASDFRSAAYFLDTYKNKKIGALPSKLKSYAILSSTDDSAIDVDNPANLKNVRPGDAVRIVLQGHPQCGETGYVLAIELSEGGMAEVKLDSTAAIEFLPMSTKADALEKPKPVFTKVSVMSFNVLVTKTVTTGFSCAWRAAVTEYARQLTDDTRDFMAARVIQCAARIYLSRIRVQQEMERQGLRSARRQQLLRRALMALGVANYRTADLLRQLRLIKESDIPSDLPDEPTAIMRITDRFKRQMARSIEIQEAFTAIEPTRYPGGELSDEYMPVRFEDHIERYLNRPMRKMRRALTYRMAKRIEASGNFDLAWLIGGKEFILTFEQRHTYVKEFQIQQLRLSEFTNSDGWAIVHGVFEKKIPHGWAVIKFLTGTTQSGIHWSREGSVQARYKALTMMKAIRRKDREERLGAQILASQSLLNDMRSREGPRGFAERHHELSEIEDALVHRYKRWMTERQDDATNMERLIVSEKDLIQEIKAEKLKWHKAARQIRDLQVIVPNVPPGLAAEPCELNPLTMLNVGSKLEVLWEDGYWHIATILSMDLYDSGIVHVSYTQEKMKETLNLIKPEANPDSEDSEEDQEEEDQDEDEDGLQPIKLDDGVLYRDWRTGGAYELEWMEPDDKGSPIQCYCIEWHNQEEPNQTGRQFVRGSPPPTQLTLWPLPCGVKYNIRVNAENKVGQSLFSKELELDFNPTELGCKMAKLLALPSLNTLKQEESERERMEVEEKETRMEIKTRTCCYCQKICNTREILGLHVAEEHGIPLLCPFKACQQPCGSRNALKYHIWHSTTTRLTAEDRKMRTLLEVYEVSRNYCLRKQRRHYLPGESHLADNGEDYYLETKFETAVTEWQTRALKVHDEAVLREEIIQERVKWLEYQDPPAVYAINYQEIEPVKELLDQTSIKLHETTEAMEKETAVVKDKLEHLEKERTSLEEYIKVKTERLKNATEKWMKQTLKRDRKKAIKKLEDVEADFQEAESVFNEFKAKTGDEISRLSKLEAALESYVAEYDKIQTLRHLVTELSTQTNVLMNSNRDSMEKCFQDLNKDMKENSDLVDRLQEWEMRKAYRHQQLKKLLRKLRVMQLKHASERLVEMKQRDEEDELFELKMLRKEQREMQLRRIEARIENGNPELFVPSDRSQTQLNIANLDPMLHEKYTESLTRDFKISAQDFADEDEEESEEVRKKREALEKMVADADGTSTKKKVRKKKRKKKIAVQKEENDDEDQLVLNFPTFESLRPEKYVRMECQLNHGVIQGNVRIEFNDGSVYEGPWEEDVTYEKDHSNDLTDRFQTMHWGKFTRPNGDVWEGEQVNNFFDPDLACGRFVVKRADSTYDGQVLHGKWHGFGTLTFEAGLVTGEYIGEWHHSIRQGNGIEIFDDGEKYEGEWKYDKYNGHGKITYADQSTYEGQFKDNEWHGQGSRTTEMGDIIQGDFYQGYLNAPGTIRFADGRYYTGEFKDTLMHGQGVLQYPNGDRYEGPFRQHYPHGEAKFFTRTSKQEGSEPTMQLGIWENGEHKKWITRPRTKLGTMTFVEYFAEIVQTKEGAQVELIKGKFRTPYAVMVASMLPDLPPGVDFDDPFVKAIVRKLARSQNMVIGSSMLEKTSTELKTTESKLEKTLSKFQRDTNLLEKSQVEWRREKKVVVDYEQELERMDQKQIELQDRLEEFWKTDPRGCERMYKAAVRKLNDLDLVEWYKVRKAKPDVVLTSLLNAFCTLLNFTPNSKLSEMYKPDKMEVIKMLANNAENVALGDREGLIHNYNIKALYLIPLFDIYSFAEGPRHQMLQNIAPVVHNPKLRPSNVRLVNVSEAAPVICEWVRAAFFFAQTACEIYPVYKRLAEHQHETEVHKIVLEKERKAEKEAEELVLKTEEQIVSSEALIETLKREKRRLDEVMENIKELDELVDLPPEKKIVIPMKDELEEKETIETTDEQSENKDEVELAKKEELRKRLDRKTGDKKLVEALDQVKTELRLIILTHNHEIPLEDIPAAYEKVTERPLDLKMFGLKKLSGLIELLSETFELERAHLNLPKDTVRLRLTEEEKRNLENPVLAHRCKLCKGISYATREERSQHKFSVWHQANRQLKINGEELMEYDRKCKAWQELFDQDGQLIYYNSITQEQVYDRPIAMDVAEIDTDALQRPGTTKEDIGEGWQKLIDEDGNMHYQHSISGEKSIERPEIKEIVITLPEGWTEHVDEEGTAYYYHAETEYSTYERPTSSSSSSWEEVYDEETGDTYFYDNESGETSWTRPPST